MNKICFLEFFATFFRFKQIFQTQMIYNKLDFHTTFRLAKLAQTLKAGKQQKKSSQTLTYKFKIFFTLSAKNIFEKKGE